VIQHLPGISKNIAFKAVSDIHQRMEWDAIVKDSNIIEEDKKHGYVIFSYPIPTPAFLKPREALVRSKTLSNFPKKGNLSIFNSSITHPKVLPDPEKIRVDLKISGFVFEDDPMDKKGCIMTWII
jgi:hypothetical protein